MRKLHPEINGETVTVDPDLAMSIHNANADHKESEKRLRGLKTRLLDVMGQAQTAVLDNGIKVATRSPHGSGSVSLNLAKTHPAVAQAKGAA
jgi:hypothetical protein